MSENLDSQRSEVLGQLWAHKPPFTGSGWRTHSLPQLPSLQGPVQVVEAGAWWGIPSSLHFLLFSFETRDVLVN